MAHGFSATAEAEHLGPKPRLSLWRIVEMNLGFLGLQFSFGLQQGNMAPIYSYLGAEEAALPILGQRAAGGAGRPIFSSARCCVRWACSSCR